MNAETLRIEAAKDREAAVESFDRCDTDGFLTQWAHGINAQLKDRQAEILENGGAMFPGLFDGERRVAAKLINTQFGESWILRDDEAARYGRKFMPCSYENNSRIHRKYNLSQRREIAPARAKIMSNGRGLSGCASAFVGSYRIGDEWGQDSKPCAEGPVF